MKGKEEQRNCELNTESAESVNEDSIISVVMDKLDSVFLAVVLHQQSRSHLEIWKLWERPQSHKMKMSGFLSLLEEELLQQAAKGTTDIV